MVLLYALVIGILFAVGLNLGLILVLAGVFLFCQYWFSDKIALFGMHGHIVTPEQEPELHGIIDRLCALADMPKPRVAVAEVDMPNAFATGRNPRTPWCAPPGASCGAWTSPSSKRSWPTSCRTWRTGTWPS